MTRTRSLQLGEYTLGVEDDLAKGEEELQQQQKSDLPSLEQELHHVETQRVQEGISAFGLGFVSLTAMAFVVRTARNGACALQSHLEPGMRDYNAVPQVTAF